MEGSFFEPIVAQARAVVAPTRGLESRLPARCPPIAEVMTGVITYMLTFDRIPELDRQGRPKMFYSQRIHDKCYRRPHFDAGQFVEAWDDESARKGYRPPMLPEPEDLAARAAGAHRALRAVPQALAQAPRRPSTCAASTPNWVMFVSRS